MRLSLKELVGCGDRIVAVWLPVAVVGVVLNVMFPDAFAVGGPADALRTLSIVVATVGIAVWLWSVVLILRHVPRDELITTGPFALVRHPLYTSVSLLVLPWVGFLLDTWLGAVLGVAMYVAARRFERDEEVTLAERFGSAWERYRASVALPWL